jgi:CRP-like cAMP-binding protein
VLQENGVPATARAGNHLIDRLPLDQRKRIVKRFKEVELGFSTTLTKGAQPFEHVYFPLTGYVSLVWDLNNDKSLELGLIGNEGMLAATLLLDVNTAPMRGLVQGAGTALRMTATQFRRALRDFPALEPLLNRYMYVMLTQLAQTAACTRFHAVNRRLARWLLMTHDRAHADHFVVTHEFLAMMLGVRRSGVTIAAGALQKQGLIRYVRGNITVLSRPGLEAASCECYSAARDAYAELLGPRSSRD